MPVGSHRLAVQDRLCSCGVFEHRADHSRVHFHSLLCTCICTYISTSCTSTLTISSPIRQNVLFLRFRFWRNISAKVLQRWCQRRLSLPLQPDLRVAPPLGEGHPVQGVVVLAAPHRHARVLLADHRVHDRDRRALLQQPRVHVALARVAVQQPPGLVVRVARRLLQHPDREPLPAHRLDRLQARDLLVRQLRLLPAGQAVQSGEEPGRRLEVRDRCSDRSLAVRPLDLLTLEEVQ